MADGILGDVPVPTNPRKRRTSKLTKHVGEQYDRLTVESVTLDRAGKNALLCKCVCGGQTITRISRLKSGTARSCGCYRRDKATKHGQAKGGQHNKVYAVWNAIVSRCTRPNDKGYKNYGGRGIRVDPKWMSFAGFYEDMGDKPEGMSIDRIDNDGDYCKANCRWADRVTQNSNKRNSAFLTVNGETKTISAWARVIGSSRGTVLSRIDRGWTIEAAATTPVRPTKRRAKAA